MEIKTATMDLKDFTYGILMGYMERYFPLDNFDPMFELKV